VTLQGYCVNTQCTKFAIAISGFGSPLTTAQDAGFESDLAAWLTNANVAKDGLHNPITSFFWNGWDASSYGEPSLHPLLNASMNDDNLMCAPGVFWTPPPQPLPKMLLNFSAMLCSQTVLIPDCSPPSLHLHPGATVPRHSQFGMLDDMLMPF